MKLSTCVAILLTVICLETRSYAHSQKPANRPPSPCTTQAEFKQFDFWVGEWDVKKAGDESGPTVGSSKIEKLMDGCAIMENWESRGFVGKSWNFYDAGQAKWRQIWIDLNGRRAEYAGVYKDGAMRIEGEASPISGPRVKSRMTFFNLSTTKVRQLVERSTDDGQTWTTAADFIYLRRQS